MRILIDADACPVPAKEILYKASGRLGLELLLVANQPMRIPDSALIQLKVVAQGADEADDYIVEIMQESELVISADIPLADRVVKKGGFVLDPRGIFLSNENIGQRLAIRDLMSDLRAGGMPTGGPNTYTNKEKQKFANQLDQYLMRRLKNK